MTEQKRKIKVTKNGPYLVSGAVSLQKENIIADDSGCPTHWQLDEKYPDQKNYAICRCGQSKNKPYCDSTHAKINFDGTETAQLEKYLDDVEKTSGPGLELTDNAKLCALARFCHRAGDAWHLTQQSADPKAKALAIQEGGDCPSGRLVAWDKNTGQPIEPKFSPGISLVEDLPHQCSGPLWVKGGIPIESADGEIYEIRNRVTLCRCGASKNKPFCDGAHVRTGFNDGDKNLNKQI